MSSLVSWYCGLSLFARISLWVVPLYAFLVWLVLSPFVGWLQRAGKAKACLRTERFLRSGYFGLATCFSGNIGAGKTTCASAVSNVLSKILRENASNKVAEIRLLLSDVDFNIVDKVVSSAFFDVHLTNTDAIMDFLLTRFPELSDRIEGQFYDTALYPVTRVSLLRDYIDAELAVLRNRYVYFIRRMFYCWPTDSWSMRFDSSMIDIKDRCLSCDYKIQRYSVVFEDEKTLGDKTSLNFSAVAKADGGGDSWIRLIRQLGKGSIFYLTTCQDFGRIVKEERELFTGIFYIVRRKELRLFSAEEIFVDVAFDLLGRLSVFLDGIREAFRVARFRRVSDRLAVFSGASALVSSDDGFSVSPSASLLEEAERLSSSVPLRVSRIRSLMKGLLDRRNRIFADSYISYCGSYWTSADDVGRAPADCRSFCAPKLDLVFPLCFAYGSVDTYSFSIVNDYLSLVSVRKADFYDPADRSVPRESDEEFSRFVRGVLVKNRDRHSSSDLGDDMG